MLRYAQEVVDYFVLSLALVTGAALGQDRNGPVASAPVTKTEAATNNLGPILRTKLTPPLLNSGKGFATTVVPKIAEMPMMQIPLCTWFPGNPVLVLQPDGTMSISIKPKSAEQ